MPLSEGDTELNTLDDTRRLARRLVAATKPGDMILLVGPLGAGKTTLVQQLALELASDADVTSPSYTLIHEYPTPSGPLIHIDAYRLPSTDALFGLGLEDYLDRARLVVVEWGEGLQERYPDSLTVHLQIDRQERRATIVGPAEAQ